MHNRCPGGEDTDCPGGMGCFGGTECYYSEDLVPTATPVVPPSLSPSTIPPVAYKDPANVRYCVSFLFLFVVHYLGGAV